MGSSLYGISGSNLTIPTAKGRVKRGAAKPFWAIYAAGPNASEYDRHHTLRFSLTSVWLKTSAPLAEKIRFEGELVFQTHAYDGPRAGRGPISDLD